MPTAPIGDGSRVLSGHVVAAAFAGFEEVTAADVIDPVFVPLHLLDNHSEL